MLLVARVGQPHSLNFRLGKTINFSLGPFASKQLSPLSNQGGHNPTSARREVPIAAVENDAAQ
jgi:hypothetical protein